MSSWSSELGTTNEPNVKEKKKKKFGVYDLRYLFMKKNVTLTLVYKKNK